MQNFQDELQALELDSFQVSKLIHVAPNEGGDSGDSENDIHIHINIDIGGKPCGFNCFSCVGHRCGNCFNCVGPQYPKTESPESPKPPENDDCD